MFQIAGAIVGMAVVLVGVLVGPAPAASDPALTCRQAVLRGAAKFADARLTALRKCEDAKRAGKLSPLVQCRTDATQAAAFAPVGAKLRATVERACGGADRRCGGADDVTLAAMGWPSTCPDLEGSSCDRPLTSCADVPDCAACLATAAVSPAVELVYAPLVVVDPKAQKTVARCQRALAAAATTLTDTRLAVMARCLAQRLAGKHAAPCPVPGDGKAAGVMVAARTKAEAKVCTACGGPDKRCGGGDDLALPLIGTVAACPGVGACGAALEGVVDLVACFDCTAAVRAECALAGVAPGVVEYPPGCALVPPTPTATVTPTPTLTPVASPTLTTTPAPTPTPVFCPAAAPLEKTTTVTLTLVTGGVPVGGASLILDYLPERVRMLGVGDDAAVRSRVTDLTAGRLFSKGAPNNQDSDGDREPDRVRFTLVSTSGVTGAVLTVSFDRCSDAALTTGTDYPCTIVAGSAVGIDGVTPIPAAACTVAVAHGLP